jgi:predicted CxxxxCH...CXXCH cytochrome family protein
MASGVGYNKGAGTLTFLNQTSVPTMGGCSTASCHVSSYGPAYVPTPNWGTVTGCAACHNATSGAAAAFDATNGAPTTGAHSLHLTTASPAVSCGTCHTNVAKDTNTSSVHINALIDVTGYAAPVAKHTINTGYTSTCSVVCHGSAAPIWAAPSQNVACTKCHGKPTITNYSSASALQAAPGYAQSAGAPYVSGVSATQPYGAHDSHLRGTSGYVAPYQIKCTDCHSIPTNSNHANGTTEFAWSNLAKNIGTSPYAANGALTPVYARPTCSINYCHGNGFVAAVKGTGLSPSWVDTNYLANQASAKNATDCNKCHMSPPTGSNGGGANSAHNAMPLTQDCSGCHGHNGSGSSHIDGTLQAGGTSCDGCHDYDTQGTTPNKTWGLFKNKNYGGFNEGNGAHAQHIEYLKTRWGGLALNPTADYTIGFGKGNAAKICGTCHTNITHSTSAPTAPRIINFGDGLSTVGTSAQALLFSTSGTPLSSAYAGSSTTSSATQAKTCSNLSCHYFTTPVWSTY